MIPDKKLMDMTDAEIALLTQEERDICMVVLQQETHRQSLVEKARKIARTPFIPHTHKKVKKQKRSWVIEVFEQTFGKSLINPHTPKELHEQAYYMESVRRKQKKQSPSQVGQVA